MELVIDAYGSYLGKEQNRFRIIQKEKKEEYSADDVDQIIIASPCSITSSALQLAVEKNIDVVFLDHFGKPYGRFFPCTLGGTTLTRRKQIEESITHKSGVLAKMFIKAKVSNQYYFLKALLKERSSLMVGLPEIKTVVKGIEEMHGASSTMRDALFGIEGNFASVYFGVLTKILPFSGRDQQGSDIVNIALNYGYGILYSQTERSCVLVGLDPYFGYLHTDRYGKPSMVLDLIEIFRSVIVDRAIVTLFVQKQLSDEDLEGEGSKILTKVGRKKITEAVLKRLNTEVIYNGKKRKYKEIQVEDARNIVRYLLGQRASYDPYIYRW